MTEYHLICKNGFRILLQVPNCTREQAEAEAKRLETEAKELNPTNVKTRAKKAKTASSQKAEA